MEWLQVITIIGVLGGFNFFMMQRMDADINALSTRLDGHAKRIDQLYQMFVDLLRQSK